MRAGVAGVIAVLLLAACAGPRADGPPASRASSAPAAAVAQEGTRGPGSWNSPEAFVCGLTVADLRAADVRDELGVTVGAQVPMTSSVPRVLGVSITLSAEGDDVHLPGARAGLVLTHDGVVVEQPGREVRSDITVSRSPVTLEAVGLTTPCVAGGAQPAAAGRWLAWPVVSVTATGALLVGDPAPYEPAQGVELAEGRPSEIPRGVPLVADRLLDVRTVQEGSAWLVSVELDGRGSFDQVVDRFQRAGYTVRWQQSIDPTHWAAQLQDDDWAVELSVDNLTGGGFYGTYWLTARDRA